MSGGRLHISFFLLCTMNYLRLLTSNSSRCPEHLAAPVCLKHIYTISHRTTFLPSDTACPSWSRRVFTILYFDRPVRILLVNSRSRRHEPKFSSLQRKGALPTLTIANASRVMMGKDLAVNLRSQLGPVLGTNQEF
jgi:hypothetical protein